MKVKCINAIPGITEGKIYSPIGTEYNNGRPGLFYIIPNDNGVIENISEKHFEFISHH